MAPHHKEWLQTTPQRHASNRIRGEHCDSKRRPIETETEQQREAEREREKERERMCVCERERDKGLKQNEPTVFGVNNFG